MWGLGTPVQPDGLGTSYFGPRGGSEVSRRACLYVCLSVTKFSVHVNFIVAVARSSSDDTAIGYVLPVSWMTSCLPVMGHYGAWLKPRLHDTTAVVKPGCTTGMTTGLTTGCIVYTNIYPVVEPV